MIKKINILKIKIIALFFIINLICIFGAHFLYRINPSWFNYDLGISRSKLSFLIYILGIIFFFFVCRTWIYTKRKVVNLLVISVVTFLIHIGIFYFDYLVGSPPNNNHNWNQYYVTFYSFISQHFGFYNFLLPLAKKFVVISIVFVGTMFFYRKENRIKDSTPLDYFD